MQIISIFTTPKGAIVIDNDNLSINLSLRTTIDLQKHWHRLRVSGLDTVHKR